MWNTTFCHRRVPKPVLFPPRQELVFKFTIHPYFIASFVVTHRAALRCWLRRGCRGGRGGCRCRCRAAHTAGHRSWGRCASAQPRARARSRLILRGIGRGGQRWLQVIGQADGSSQGGIGNVRTTQLLGLNWVEATVPESWRGAAKLRIPFARCDLRVGRQSQNTVVELMKQMLATFWKRSNRKRAIWQTSFIRGST